MWERGGAEGGCKDAHCAFVCVRVCECRREARTHTEREREDDGGLFVLGE